jgi:hypothetical protein
MARRMLSFAQWMTGAWPAVAFGSIVLVIWIFGFEFVSDFGFRASDLTTARPRWVMGLHYWASRRPE